MYLSYEIGFLIIFFMCVFVDKKITKIRKHHAAVIKWLYCMQTHEQPLTQEQKEQLKFTYLDSNGIHPDMLYNTLAKSIDPSLKKKEQIEIHGKMYLDKIMGK